MKRVLVTGGAGFIGRHTIRLLEERGYDVIALDWDPMKMRELQCLHKITGDIKDRPMVNALIAEYQPQGIIHLAAQNAVAVSMASWDLDAQQNIIGTISILDAARVGGVKRVVYAASGGSVYGNAETVPVREDTPLNPMSPYGISKMAAEFYVRISGISHAVLRYPNVYGLGQDPKGLAGVVAIFIGNMMDDKPCVIYGDGHQERDYVYVEDIARANVLALESTSEGIFNIGSGEGVTVNTIHRLIASQLGKSIWPKNEDARPGEVRKVYLDPSKANKELNWRPMVGLEDGIKKTIEYVADARRTRGKSPLSCGGEAGSIPARAINTN